MLLLLFKSSAANISLTADAGSFAVTGSAATLTKTWLLSADAGSFLITGTAASLERGRLLTADAGSYAFTGVNVTLNKGVSLVADAGSYACTGTDADLLKTWILTADTGSFAFTGTDVDFELVKTLVAASGSYDFTGTEAFFIYVQSVANTVAPVVSGTPTQGSTLSCTEGTWTGTLPIFYTFQWRRDGENMLDQTGSTYVVRYGDIGHSISCIVTATNVLSVSSQVSNSVTITGSRHETAPRKKFGDATRTGRIGF